MDGGNGDNKNIIFFLFKNGVGWLIKWEYRG